VASIYSKPDSRKKSVLLVHISETYNLLCSKYNDGLYFIIAGDTSDLKLDPILNLSPNMRQVVTDFERMNPPRILDPILTTMAKFYQPPLCFPPLDPDPDSNGIPAEHLMVEMRPISTLNNRSARTKRKVKIRPLPESGLTNFGNWIKEQNWQNVYDATTAYDKACILQIELLKKLNEFLPEKMTTFSSDDQVWMTAGLKKLDHRRKIEFRKHRKSQKWFNLNSKFEEKSETAEENDFTNMIEDLKTSNPDNGTLN
jgi:hypothetical protein